MNNHVLIPTNLNDSTETLTKNAKIVFVYDYFVNVILGESYHLIPMLHIRLD